MCCLLVGLAVCEDGTGMGMEEDSGNTSDFESQGNLFTEGGSLFTDGASHSEVDIMAGTA